MTVGADDATLASAMRSDEFNALFASLVTEPLAGVGFERWGKSLWFAGGGLRAAVLRTEQRNAWPFHLTLVVGHDCLRDFDDRLPAPRSRNVSEWPVKWQPSQSAQLGTERWRYTPWNLGSYPYDAVADDSAEEQLRAIASTILQVAPELPVSVSAEQVLERLRDQPQLAWCERRWIEDYERHLG